MAIQEVNNTTHHAYSPRRQTLDRVMNGTGRFVGNLLIHHWATMIAYGVRTNPIAFVLHFWASTWNVRTQLLHIRFHVYWQFDLCLEQQAYSWHSLVGLDIDDSAYGFRWHDADVRLACKYMGIARPHRH